MKTSRLFPLIFLAVLGCTTAQLNQAKAIAGPIAKVAVEAAAAYFGVPPTATVAIESGAAALWGAVQQARAGQPIANGTTLAPVGAAITLATPSNLSPDSKAALLTMAATLAK